MQDTNQDAQPQINIDELATSVDFGSLYEAEIDRKQVNFWIDEEYQARFHNIQRKTRKKFGRQLIKLIEKCIDMAEAADPHRQDRTA